MPSPCRALCLSRHRGCPAPARPPARPGRAPGTPPARWDIYGTPGTGPGTSGHAGTPPGTRHAARARRHGAGTGPGTRGHGRPGTAPGTREPLPGTPGTRPGARAGHGPGTRPGTAARTVAQGPLRSGILYAMNDVDAGAASPSRRFRAASPVKAASASSWRSPRRLKSEGRVAGGRARRAPDRDRSSKSCGRFVSAAAVVTTPPTSRDANATRGDQQGWANFPECPPGHDPRPARCTNPPRAVTRPCLWQRRHSHSRTVVPL